MDEIIYKCKSRASDREGHLLRWSLNWAFARRGELRLTNLAIELGDWYIPYDTIDDAVLLDIPTPMGTAYNLVVMASGKTYHFQLRSTSIWRWLVDPFWMGEIPFPMRRETARIDGFTLL